MRDIKKFLRAYQSLVLSSTILLFVVIGFIFGIIPASRRALAIANDAVELRTQTEELRKKAATLAAIDEATYKQYLANLVTAVPADQSLTSLFSTIDGLTTQTGITLTDLGLTKPGALATESARNQSTEEKKIGTNLLPFAVTITGTYDQIREFLRLAVSVRRFFRVRGFSLSLVDPTNVSVRMTMDAFYAPYLAVIGGVDVKIEPLSAEDEAVIQTVSNMPLVSDPALELSPLGPAGDFPIVPKSDPFAP